MNSFKRVRAFQIKLEFGSVGFRGEGKTGVPGEKPLGARERTNNKLNPHMASTPGVEPGPHWWEASVLTTTPPLLHLSCNELIILRRAYFRTVRGNITRGLGASFV